MSGALATAFALTQRRSWGAVPPLVWGFLGAFVLCEAANFLLFFAAISSGDAAAGAATHYLAPLLVGLASPLVHEPSGRRARWAAPIAFVATAVLVGAGGGGATMHASLLGAGSAVFYAANVLLSKRLVRHFTPVEALGFHNLAAAPIVWAFSRTPPWAVPAHELALACTGAVLAGTVAAFFYFWGLQRVTAARAAVLTYFEPVSASVVAAVVLGEALSLVRIAAIAVILSAGIWAAAEKDAAMTAT